MSRLRPESILLPALFVLYMALGTTGYGTDNDIYEMLRRGGELLRDGTYRPSRSPGYPLPEIVLGALGPVGGHLATNALSASLGVLAIACFHRLLRDVLRPGPALLTAGVAALNPYWILACSSSMDYVYAAAFFLAGALAARHARFRTAAVLMALAVAARATYLPYGLIVYGAAFLACSRPGSASEQGFTRAARWRVAGATALFMGLALLPYALIYLAIGREMLWVYTGKPVAFFGLEGYARVSEFAGRFVFKNIFLWGAPAFAVLTAAAAAGFARRVRRAAPRDATIRARALPVSGFPLPAVGAALMYTEVLFFRLPLEISYLLPVLFLGAFLLNFAPRAPVFLGLILAAQVAYGVVSLELLRIRYHQYGFNGKSAEGASFSPHFAKGVLVKDLEVRAEAEVHYFNRFELRHLPSRHAGKARDPLSEP